MYSLPTFNLWESQFQGVEMIQSMTAFSRVQNEVHGQSVCWELKSVNHRYLDLSFRLPDAFRSIEVHLRERLRGQINRGKLECQLKISSLVSDASSMTINTGLVHALANAGAELAITQDLANDLKVSTVLAWPGVLEIAHPKVDLLSPSIETLFQEALNALLDARLTEGAVLKEHIKSRVDLLNDELIRTRAQVALMPEQKKEQLLARLEHIQMHVDDARVEQEIAIILIRLDVSEELDRLQTHLQEVSRILECEQVAGRRLDFLMQELNREANTISSKSDSVSLTQHAVQMKVLIEQMREQIQNIE